MEKEEFVAALGRHTGSDALVFVHGYNTSFEDGLFRLAQLAWDIQYKGIPVLFSWPSAGRMRAYLRDRDSADFSRKSFVDLIKLLRSSGIDTIHVIAHSMGNRVVLEGLHAYCGELRASIKELVMAAPDVDIDNFRTLQARLKNVAKGMTLYASEKDRPLFFSGKAAGRVRLGGVTTEPIEDVDIIDVGHLADKLFALNHSTFADVQMVMEDMARLIADSERPPHNRTRTLRPMPEGQTPPKYWQFPR